jgi:hypothetical protein
MGIGNWEQGNTYCGNWEWDGGVSSTPFSLPHPVPAVRVSHFPVPTSLFPIV